MFFDDDNTIVHDCLNFMSSVGLSETVYGCNYSYELVK